MGIVGVTRRSVRLVVAATCLGGLVLGAAGCASAPKPAPTQVAPTVAAIFASDEEALAAATEAYANYLELSSTVAHEGGRNSQRMADVAVGEALDTETSSLEEMLNAGTVGVGELTFDSLKIQTAELSTGRLSAYVCLDVSGSDVVDGSGASVVSSDRVNRLPLEIGFVFDPENRRLLLERTRTWSGEDFCSH